jgi:hypothetical protein
MYLEPELTGPFYFKKKIKKWHFEV